MKKSILKGIILGLVFFLTLIVASKIMNKGNADMTAQMQAAGFPVLYMSLDGYAYNELHGYAQAMEIPYMRENITVLGEDRELNFAVQTYGADVSKLSFEVRSADGQRLIENTQVTDFQDENGTIMARIVLKDLIEHNQEYALIFLLETGGGQVIRYYTRVIWSTEYAAAEKLAYVMDFNEKTFDKEAVEELAKYMETNSQGDNSTLAKVTIHSTLSQVSWGNLAVKRELQPVAELKELASQTASIGLHYVVSLQENGKKQYYYVEEFYRIRYTKDRTYLLDFEREMTRFFVEESENYVNDKIVLGIGQEDIPFVESQEGNYFAFVMQNKLCSYSVTENKLAVLFSFYDENNRDVRTIYNHHNFKILNVDESGNVQFAIYGYMNRGRHEGQVGIQICNYDSMHNTVEELVYIPYEKSALLLENEMQKLLYLNPNGKLYFALEGMIYEVDPEAKTYRQIFFVSQDDSLQVSDSQQVISWQVGDHMYSCQELILMDLNSGEQKRISAGAEEYVRPLGFMGEDLIYGYARQEDIHIDGAGRITFHMYKVVILRTDGTVLLQYMQPDVYVTGCTIEENQIVLQRCVKNGAGGYLETASDQIMNTDEEKVSKNRVGTVITEKYQKILQITVKKAINAEGVQKLTPKEVLFEGSRELVLAQPTGGARYYVYGMDGVHGVFSSPANAINLAYEISGVVLNDQGQYVWIRGNRAQKNQIMAITAGKITEEKDSVAVCLDTMLKFEGILRGTEDLLESGQTIYSILESNLTDAQILDLKGCGLDAVLYYVDQDIPVLASLSDGNAVLIVGFNQYNIVVMDPLTGKLEMKGINDSAAWLEENGNGFITYIK